MYSSSILPLGPIWVKLNESFIIKVNNLGWIVPVKNNTATYFVNDSIYYLYTESAFGSDGKVSFNVYTASGDAIVGISWRFLDWGYFIFGCTPFDYSHKLTTTPTAVVNKTWEARHTTDELKMKCNGIEVLHFIYTNTYLNGCTLKAKGKEVSLIIFTIHDTATKKFMTGLINGM